MSAPGISITFQAGSGKQAVEPADAVVVMPMPERARPPLMRSVARRDRVQHVGEERRPQVGYARQAPVRAVAAADVGIPRDR